MGWAKPGSGWKCTMRFCWLGARGAWKQENITGWYTLIFSRRRKQHQLSPQSKESCKLLFWPAPLLLTRFLSNLYLSICALICYWDVAVAKRQIDTHMDFYFFWTQLLKYICISNRATFELCFATMSLTRFFLPRALFFTTHVRFF